MIGFFYNMEPAYIQTKIENLNFYQAVPLYFKNKAGKIVLYKPAGIKLHDVRLERGLHPEKLLLKRSDKIRSIREIQKTLNLKLIEDIKANNPANVKKDHCQYSRRNFYRAKKWQS